MDTVGFFYYDFHNQTEQVYSTFKLIDLAKVVEFVGIKQSKF